MGVWNFRTRIILALADGLSNQEAAGRLATRHPGDGPPVWRARFARYGLAGYPTNNMHTVTIHIGIDLIKRSVLTNKKAHDRLF